MNVIIANNAYIASPNQASKGSTLLHGS